MIACNAQQVLRQVDALLDSSKMAAGQMTVNLAAADAVALLQAAAKMFAPRAQQHRIRVILDTPELLDADMDIEKFQGIFSNLLSNAFKYTPDEGIIRCSLRTGGDMLTLEVADSGPGIPPDQRSAIFERFHQVDGGANRRRGGTGLGLSIVHDFAAPQGGAAEALAAPEGGALVVVRLALHAPPGTEVAKVGAPAVAEWMAANVDASPIGQAHKSVPPSRQGDRLTLLVNEILDASALEHGQVSLKLSEVDLRSVAIDVCQPAAAVAAGNAVPPIEVHADAPVQGRWDQLRVEQIVTNLLSNAIKYGSGNLIDITVYTEGNSGLLRVQDHGIGIAPKDQARVFQRFERAASLRHISGLGMGLYIVHETVAALHGSIELVSQLGVGSTFVVRLPLLGPPLTHADTATTSAVSRARP